MGVKLYNRLPERINMLNDFKSFKKKLNFYSSIILFVQLKNFCIFTNLSMSHEFVCNGNLYQL
jgi:hypothetical protein